jgi:hypothetical protein
MAVLPYMRQLPTDWYKKNYPVPSAIVTAPQISEEQPVPIVPILGTDLPPPSGGGIEEAPTDGGTYARQMSAWTRQWDGGSY